MQIINDKTTRIELEQYIATKSNLEQDTARALYWLLQNNYIKSFALQYSIALEGHEYKFDFIVFGKYNRKIAIELQGQQHYQLGRYSETEDKLLRIRKSDMVKKDYCLKNNISLIIYGTSSKKRNEVLSFRMRYLNAQSLLSDIRQSNTYKYIENGKGLL